MYLLSFNICGVGGDGKVRDLSKLLKSTNPDIILSKRRCVVSLRRLRLFLGYYHARNFVL